MPKKAVDIRDVAALAGVSVGSASRVINGALNVTPVTRARVEQAIITLGYRPNHAARSLRSRSSKTVGCLFSDVTNPLYARVFRSLEDRLEADGYMLLLANGLNEAPREARTLDMFGSRGMDGVIAAPGNERDPQVLASLAALGMPVIILDRDIRVATCDALLFDHRAGMKAAMNALFGCGHRRIALALWRATSRPVRRRVEGYRAAFREAGLSVPDLIIQGASATSSVFDEVAQMLARPDRPTAIIAQGTYTLWSTLRAIEARGLRIPDDISVLTIGDIEFARDHSPAISLLTVDVARIAEQTATLLAERRRDPQRAAQRVMVPITFTNRGSIGPAPR